MDMDMETRKQSNDHEFENLLHKGFRSTNKALVILSRLNRAEEEKRVFKSRLVAFRGKAA